MKARAHWTLALCCAALALAVGWSGTGGDFLYDDRSYVVENTAVVADAAAFCNPTPPTIRDVTGRIDDARRLGLYRPITELSYRLDFRRSGLDARTFHRTNLLLHALVTGLVALLALRLLGNLRAAAIAGGVFAVHPVHVEAVAWVVGRAEILATLFAILAVLVHGRPAVRRAALRPWCGALLYLAAALAKESAITLPAALCLLDLSADRVAPVARRCRRLAGRMLPYALTVAALVAVRIAVLGRFGPDVSLDPLLGGLAPGERLRLGAGVLGSAVLHLLAPIGLSISYSQAAVQHGARVITGTVLLVGGLLWLARSQRRTAPPATFGGVALFGVAMLPFLHLVPIGALFADRFLYLPSVGFCVWLGAVASQGSARVQVIALAGITLVLPTFATLSLLRAPVFRDELRLWEDAVAKDDSQALSHYLLGQQYQRAGLLDPTGDSMRGAIHHLRRSLELDANHPLAPYAHLTLGIDAIGRHRDVDAGLRHYRTALACDPNFADAMLHLAALRPSGRISAPEADALLRRALRLPLSAEQRTWAEQELKSTSADAHPGASDASDERDR